MIALCLLLVSSQIVKGQNEEETLARDIYDTHQGVQEGVLEFTSFLLEYGTIDDLFDDKDDRDLMTKNEALSSSLFNMVMNTEEGEAEKFTVTEDAETSEVILEIYVKMIAEISLIVRTDQPTKANNKKRSKGLLLIKKIKKVLKKGSGYQKLMHPMLLAATVNGHYDIVQVLLMRYNVTANDVNRRDRFTLKNVLSWACGDNQLDIVKLLLKIDGINVDTDDRDGKGVLYHPSLRGHSGVVKLLLKVDGIDINKRSNEGVTALYIAAEYNRLDIVKLLLQIEDIKVNLPDIDNTTPLYMASALDRVDVVQELLNAKEIDVNTVGTLEQHFTPLFVASIKGNWKTVQLLLNAEDINVNHRCTRGGTALYAAAVNGKVKVVRVLLKNKKIARRVNQGLKKGHPLTALISAVDANHIKVVKALLKVKGIRINKGFYATGHGFVNALTVVENQRNKLHKSAKKQIKMCDKMRKLLLKHGAKRSEEKTLL